MFSTLVILRQNRSLPPSDFLAEVRLAADTETFIPKVSEATDALDGLVHTYPATTSDYGARHHQFHWFITRTSFEAVEGLCGVCR